MEGCTLESKSSFKVAFSADIKVIGKFIVASSDAEEEELQKIFEKGNNNGAKDLRLISKEELEKLEPNVKAKSTWQVLI